MKRILKSVALFAMLFFTVIAVAQPRQGGFTGNSNFMNIHMLTKHLDLTEEQVTAIEALLEAQKEEIKALRTSGGDRQAQLEAVRKIKDETEAKILELLTEEQLVKYNELLEKQGTRGQVTPQVMPVGGGYIGYLDRHLDLTDEQETAIQTILEDQRNQMKALRRNGHENADREEIKAEFERIREETETAIKALLTPEQLTAYDELLSKRNIRGGGKMLNPNDLGGKKMKGKLIPNKKGSLKGIR